MRRCTISRTASFIIVHRLQNCAKNFPFSNVTRGLTTGHSEVCVNVTTPRPTEDHRSAGRHVCRPARAAKATSTQRVVLRACVRACAVRVCIRTYVASRCIVSKATVGGVGIARRCTVLSAPRRTVTARGDKRGQREGQRDAGTTAADTRRLVKRARRSERREGSRGRRESGKEGEREKRERQSSANSWCVERCHQPESQRRRRVGGGPSCLWLPVTARGSL